MVATCLCLWNACGGSATFVSRSPNPRVGDLYISLGSVGSTTVSLQPEGVSRPISLWSLNRPISHIWVGWSRNGDAISLLACAGPDHRTMIERLAPKDLLEVGKFETPDFVESDRDLLRSLRSTFDLGTSKSDEEVIFWFCGRGEGYFRERFWPTGGKVARL